MVKSRPVMRYPGGKYLLASWIIEHFPAHQTYVELFGGAASVLMRKSRSAGEVYNELDDDIVNVFRILRDPIQAEELARVIELTPFAYQEYRDAYDASENPIERARRVIFRSFAGIGSDAVCRARAGFRGGRCNKYGGTSARSWSGYHDFIAQFVERLQYVIIESRPALKIIDIYDDPQTLFYADPPYVMNTRTSRTVEYRYEMDDDEHVILGEKLHQIRGMAIVSGYRCELYDQIYADWMRVEHIGKVGLAKPGAQTRVECLWMSPNIKTRMF